MTRSIPAILLVLAMSALAEAQSPRAGGYDVGWFDHRDSRAAATGLGTLMGFEPGLRPHSFKLGDPAAFKLESWDMVVFGSFSELDPAWDGFVRREKDRLLRWVRGGGILVQMCRYRKSDRDGSRKLELLPPGYEVFRGSDDVDEWHASADLLPLWRGIDDKLKREGTGGNNPSWYRRPSGAFGNLDNGALDAFERWSEQFTRSAGKDMRIDGRYAYAVHAGYGKGQILLFQLILDKYDGARNPLSQGLSKTFFSCLMSYGRERPNPGKKSVRPVTIPDPDPVPTLPTTLRIEGRAFVDLDRDGRYDRNEPPVVNLRLRDLEGSTTTDANGRYSLSRSRKSAGFLSIELPEGHLRRGGWFEYLAADAKQRVLVRDFALLEREGAPRRVLVTALPTGLDDAVVRASFESKLVLAARKEEAPRVILLAGQAKRADLGAMKDRLEALMTGDPGFSLHIVAGREGAGLAELGPDRWSFQAAGRSFASVAGRPRSPTGDSPLVILAADLAEARRVTAEGRLVAVAAEAGANAEGLTLVPELVDPADLESDARYLVFEVGPEGLGLRREPESSRREPTGPQLPIHPWGRGNIGALLEQAIEDARD